MIGRDTREDMDADGPWPWVGGLVPAAVLIWLMFAFSAPVFG